MVDKLLDACEIGDLDAVKLLLMSTDVNSQDENGRTALIEATRGGQVEVVQLLINSGADVYIRDNNDTSAMFLTCIIENIDITKIIFKNLVDLNHIDNDGFTALTMAVMANNIPVVKLLIELNVDLDKTRGVYTPLHLAVERRYFEVAILLIEAGAKFDIPNANGHTVLMIALVQGFDDLASLMINKIPANCPNLEKRITSLGPSIFGLALGCTKLSNNLEIINLLISKLSTEYITNSKEVFLGVACREEGFEIAELLLNIGCRIDDQCGEGWTALMYASKNNIDAVKLLVNKGANVDLQNNSGTTALMYAIDTGKLEIVKFLVENGADVNIKDNRGITALLDSCVKENYEIAKILIAGGAELYRDEAQALIDKTDELLMGFMEFAKDKLSKMELENKSERSISRTIIPEIEVFKAEQVDDLLKYYTTQEQEKQFKSLIARIKNVSSLKKLATIPENWEAYCVDLEAKFPNFAEVILYIRNQMSLAARSDRALRLSPLLLNGPSGVGKTAFLLTLATDLNTTLKVIDVSSSQSGSPLSGTESHWANSQPGVLWTTLMFGDVGNPIFMLDEIDKAHSQSKYQPLSPLHALLEKRQAKRFSDLCLPEFHIDASHVIWIATSNSTETIEKQIIDRFIVFNIEKPSVEQMKSIVANQYLRYIDDEPYGHLFEKTIREDVLDELTEHHPRKVRKILEMAFGAASYSGRTHLTIDDIHNSNVNEKPVRGIGFTCSM